MDKIMAARRANFERFAREHYWLSEFPQNRDEYQPDEYVDPEMNVAWESWNAAIDSLCVELPHPMRIPDEDEYDGDYEAYEIEESHAITMNRLLSECKESIHAAGVKTK